MIGHVRRKAEPPAVLREGPGLVYLGRWALPSGGHNVDIYAGAEQLLCTWSGSPPSRPWLAADLRHWADIAVPEILTALRAVFALSAAGEDEVRQGLAAHG